MSRLALRNVEQVIQNTFSECMPRRLVAWGVAVTLSISSSGGALAADPITFAPAIAYSTQSAPFAVALGDLNGDGHADLVVGNSSSATVSVRLGDGLGGFGARVDIGTSAEPISLALVDVNADGAMDLLVAHRSANEFTVHLGNGTGGFTSGGSYAMGAYVWQLATGDLNGDGKIDVVTADYVAGTLSIRLGNGTGGFGARTTVTSGNGPHAVAIADVDGDAKADLLCGNFLDNTVSCFLGDGAGGFSPRTDFAVGTSPVWVSVGDVDIDGAPDLVVTNLNSNDVSVLLGDHAGSFDGRVDYALGTRPYQTAFADLNADGRSDLVAVDNTSNSLDVLLADNAGGFYSRLVFTISGAPADFATADLNADGRVDVVATRNDAAQVDVLLNTSPAGLTPPALNVANGSYYQRVQRTSVVSWDTAKLDAQGMSHLGRAGHLATLTNNAENSFINGQPGGWNFSWIGGSQAPGSPEPSGGWSWVTGEAWAYTRWSPTNPNNLNGNEDALEWRSYVLYPPNGAWNDRHRSGVTSGSNTMTAYIVEYDAPPACVDTLTIADVQNTLAPCHPATGSPAWGVAGVVTAIQRIPSGPTFYMQVRPGGPHSGIRVFAHSAAHLAPFQLAVGDSVRVYGRTAELEGGTAIVASNDPSDTPDLVIGRLATGVPLATPFAGTTTLFRESPGNTAAEPYEGALVQITGPLHVARVAGLGSGNFLVVSNTAPSDSIFVDMSTLTTIEAPAVGTALGAVVGVLDQRSRGYRILVRDFNDVSLPTPPGVLRAFALDDTRVRVRFDRPVTSASATNISNYSLASFGSIDAAEMVGTQAVDLTVSGAAPHGSSEAITVNGVSAVGSGLTMGTPASRSFVMGALDVQELRAPDPDSMMSMTCVYRSSYSGADSALGPMVTLKAGCIARFGSLYAMATAGEDSVFRTGLLADGTYDAFAMGAGAVYVGQVRESVRGTLFLGNDRAVDDGTPTIASLPVPKDTGGGDNCGHCPVAQYDYKMCPRTNKLVTCVSPFLYCDRYLPYECHYDYRKCLQWHLRPDLCELVPSNNPEWHLTHGDGLGCNPGQYTWRDLEASHLRLEYVKVTNITPGGKKFRVALMGSADTLSVVDLASNLHYSPQIGDVLTVRGILMRNLDQFTVAGDPIPGVPETWLHLAARGDLDILYHGQNVDVGPTSSSAEAFSLVVTRSSTGPSRIRFATGRSQHVRLAVFDVGGRILRTLVDETVGAGEHALEWDGRTDTRARVAPGVFFVQLRSGDRMVTAKTIWMH